MLFFKTLRRFFGIKTRQENVRQIIDDMFPRRILYFHYRNDFELNFSNVRINVDFYPTETLMIRVRKFLIRWQRLFEDHGYYMSDLAYVSKRDLAWFGEAFGVCQNLYRNVVDHSPRYA